VEAKLPSGEPIVYVDDQEKNLAPARERGWRTILADEEGTWVGKLPES
jgi:putative hydrolase of the HAD superfamily